MASTVREITVLFDETIESLSLDTNNWLSFLKCASMNYKYDFMEQLLIYAQKPSAVACADYDTWNNKLNRYVKGAGIALLTEYNGLPRLKYVWDISNTFSKYGRYKRPIKIWKVDKKYELEMIESLNNKYGELDNTETFKDTLISVARVLTDDNYCDYFTEFMENINNTKLENMEELFVEKSYRNIMENSIAFMLMNRCGINPDNYFSVKDFDNLSDFIELDTITRFGSAISDIAEMGIKEIHISLKNIQIHELEENRTFEKENKINYYESEKEGSNENENDLSKSRRLLHTKSKSDTKESIQSREIFNDEVRVLEREQESRLSNTNDEEHISRPLGGNREISSNEINNNNERIEETIQYNRRIEDEQPNEVGGTNEQHQTLSRGNNLERTDLHLEYYDKNSYYCPRVVVDYQVNRILSQTPFLKASSNAIIDYFELEKDIEKRAEYLKSIFNIDYAQVVINNIAYGYKAYENGVLFWEGSYKERTAQYFIEWEYLTYHFDSMILLKQIVKKPNEQISLLNLEPQEDKKVTFEFTDEFLEKYLLEFNYETKVSINSLYETGMLQKDRVNFLKDMYGLSGASHTVKGAGVGYSAGAKGLVLYCGSSDNKIEKLYSWKYIEKTIDKLINDNRYLLQEEVEKTSKNIKLLTIEEIDNEEIEINDEVGLINHVLSVHKIYDVNVNINSNDQIVAYDDDNTWVGKELYDFLFNEVFVYNENGKIDLLDTEEVEQLREYQKRYNPEIIVQKDIIDFYNELHIKYEENLGTPNFYLDEDKKISTIFINDDFSLSYQRYLIYLLENLRESEENVPEEYIEKIENELDIIRENNKKYIGKEVSINDKVFIITDIIEQDDDYQNGDLVGLEEKETGIKDQELFEFVKFILEEKDTKKEEIPYSLAEKNIVDLVDINDNEEIIDEPEKEDLNEIKKKEKLKNYVLHPEIPYESRINYKIKDDYLGVGTTKERFKNNINAIKVLKKCEMEDRYATPEEQEILSKYVGWGGLADAFDVSKLNWNNEYNELKSLLTEDEYNLAKDSVLTAFYTPPVVIKAMYKVLSNIGLEKGNILEPSCGIGNFIGMLPNNEKLKIYGVEIDDISGRIARQLYQKSSIAIQGFEKTDYSNSFFDVAIGNVPFGNYPLYDKKYDKYKFLIHDYFFAKTIDKVRPGGIIAFITSQGTLDKENDNVRRYIAQRADLIGAIRLPNNTFKDSAGTTVTSDIIFLQKRDAITDIMPSWVNIGKTEDGLPINQYFLEHPDKVLGEYKLVSGQYEPKPACVPFEDKTLQELLENAILDIKAEIKEYELEDTEDDIDKSIEADPNVANFSFSIIDDQIYYRENSLMFPQEFALTTENRVRGLIELRDCTRELISLQLEDYPDDVIKRQQEKLNNLYDTFTKKYGIINSRANASAFDADSSYYLLCSLENLDKKGNFKSKADMFFKRTIKPNIEVTHVDTSIEALVLSMSNKTVVDFQYMENLTGFNKDKLISDLEGEIFRIPDSDKWVTADEYLSGNVREKLEVAEHFASEDDSFKINVEYLKKAMPEDIPTGEIGVRLGATWIPVNIYEQFMYELLDISYYYRDDLGIQYSEMNGEYYINGKHIQKYNITVTNTYGTKRANAYRLYEDALNLRDTKIFDYVLDEEGKKKAVFNKKETAIAQSKQDLIKEKFKDWIWSDPERREQLTKLYNKKFNSIVTREYNGSNLAFVGINPEITLREHQENAIARVLYGGNTLLAHEVGAGKTFEMVASAMESKRLGLCNKSLFVVPNHIIAQFAAEFLQLYPSANILVSRKKDFETANRKKFCSKIATGDYDAIIIGHSQFEKLPMSAERQIQLIDAQINDIVTEIEEFKRKNGDRHTIKQMMRTKKGLENKLEKLNNQSRKDNVITFEELGVDRLFVDEAHYYKNLYLYTKMRNVGGIAQTEAQKSSDLFLKCRYLDELTNNKGVIFATGTPISNSMVELYTMQRYLQYDTLKKYGLEHFDSWASTYGETVTAIELSPEGTGYRSKTRFAKFYNLPELMTMFKEIADIKTADTLNLPVPEAEFINVVVQPSEIQEEIVKSLSERAEKIRNKEVKPYEDNMLKITNDGRKLALDQRLIDEMLPDYENSKVSVCADNIYANYKEYDEYKASQLVFCDLSTPNNDGKFNVYDDLKKKLILRGIPEEEIAYIHEANTEIQKKELFAKVREGEVRVLIGSTQKMGAGTNCQDRLIAIHNLDCPWRPSDLIQRLGRIVRQGNMFKKIKSYTYVTERTFDAYLYQLVENKQKFISQIMTSKTPVRYAEDIDEKALSYAEIKALAAGNPLIIEKTSLDAEVTKLKLLKQNYLNQKYDLEDKIRKQYPNHIKYLENLIESYKLELETVNEYDEEFKTMIVKDKEYDNKNDAGQALLDNKISSKDAEEIGEYKGFKILSYYDSFMHHYKLTLKNNLSHTFDMGDSALGNITRIENVLKSFSLKIDESMNDLETTKAQLEKAKEEVDKPFAQESELKEKSKRLEEVNILLNMNEKTDEIMDEPDDVEVETHSNNKEYER